MESVWNWIIQVFTSGAFLILGLYLAAPLLHLVQGFEGRRRLRQRILKGKLNPQGFETRVELGEVYLRAHSWRKAAAELEEAIRIHSDHAHCRWLHGQALFHLERHAEAIAEMEEALRLRPSIGYGKTQLLVARAYEALGRGEEAALWYRNAIERNSSICEPGYRLALLLKREGNLEGYKKELEEVTKRFSSYDRTNYCSNLLYSWRSRLRLLMGA